MRVREVLGPLFLVIASSVFNRIGNPEPENSIDESPTNPSLPGQGHGRAKPIPSSPILPSFSSLVNNDAVARGRGRGYGPINASPRPSSLPKESEHAQQSPALKPNDRKSFSFIKGDTHDDETSAVPTSPGNPRERSLPSNIIDILSGAGRGKPKTPPVLPTERSMAENRHLRPRQHPKPRVVNAEDGAGDKSSPREKLSTEEKVKKAVGILSRGEEGGGARGRGGFRGGRGWRGGRGRGRFGGRGGRGQDRYQDSDDELGGLYLGDPAEGEKLAQKLGPETMNKLVEGFEEMSSRVLPSPVDDAYLDALHTNLMIECEPEYLMEVFGSNPDIDEKPPISLRDALDKVKPFFMAYEGIQSQEEWEEAIEETMKNVPLMEKIVDYYSGPDRVTAKQQQQELERVAKTIPENTSASVKNFVDRAVLSLQSNPGWGFDKKCQFMDKLVLEVSQQPK
ncbi:hydroxyproline-rich glycoprotein family protein [Forsythia ovata]|uniref:Hydroxyproline-rich glycoprotein family protein n=1 Tax=Forsythia ovata TaxID=205694 RepID=A0ABD1S769_9LAMI